MTYQQLRLNMEIGVVYLRAARSSLVYEVERKGFKWWKGRGWGVLAAFRQSDVSERYQPVLKGSCTWEERNWYFKYGFDEGPR